MRQQGWWPTFEAFVGGPAADDEEHCEGGDETSQNHSEGGAIVAIPVLAKDYPDDHQDQRPEPMEHGGDEAHQGDIIGGKGPPPPQHCDCRHAC